MTGQGTVKSTDGATARVLVTASRECSGCASKGHCGMGNVKPHEITVLNRSGAKTGDYIEFEAETGKVILSAALIWILPVLSMILGYLVADRFVAGVWPIISAFIFLVMSYVVLKGIDLLLTGGTTFYPSIIRIIPKSEFLLHCGLEKQ